MVFPSLMFNVEPGTVSQFSALAVIGFSIFIHQIKKIILFTGLLIMGLWLYTSQVYAYYMPQQQNNNYSLYQNYNTNNMNFYGRPWGYAPPMYFYPQLQYHSLWGPQQPYYFNSHPQSPYAPNYNCPSCNSVQPQQFPLPVVHPGGGMS